MSEFELVRVAKGMVERLLAEEPQRVMLAGLERQDDGTVELVFRRPDDRGAVEALREWLAADDAAEADFTDETEARLDAAVKAARAIVGGQS